jgi:L-amino acid N-acyltransferase YncA
VSTESIPVSIGPMTREHWAAVRAIYEEGIATRNATFEKSAPDWEKWDTSHLPGCRLIASSGRDVLGWAALSPISSRCVYAGVAEVSVYVSDKARGRKIGTKLLSALVKASEHEGIWSLQAGIFPENITSIQMHKNCGFSVVGARRRLGRSDTGWRDVVLMERRSEVVGTD